MTIPPVGTPEYMRWRDETDTVARRGFARSVRDTPAEEWAAHVAGLELNRLVAEGRRRSVFPVCHVPCGECLFSPSRVVSARRMAEVLSDAARSDTHFVCHKATLRGHDVACRAWFDRFHSTASRLAEVLGLVRFVRVESLK